MKLKLTLLALFAVISSGAFCSVRTVKLNVKPNGSKSVTIAVNSAIKKAITKDSDVDTLVVELKKGVYNFFPEKQLERTYYISNHDQDNPKSVGVALEGCKNLIIDGNGAEFVFHGRMLPIAIVDGEGCELRNVSIDFAEPHISQVTIVENDTANGLIAYKPEPWVKYDIEDGVVRFHGDGWSNVAQAGIAFDSKSRMIVYNTSDISVGVNDASVDADGVIRAPWRNNKLNVGDKVAMRTYDRPAPAIFLAGCKDSRFRNVIVHYAEGMGLLAQLCENISLDGFRVCLRGDDDPRYFTTQADATHFSGCKGSITSVNGLYENMMDDAINVHGTYLSISKRIGHDCVEGEYMHHQSWGFAWGFPGDSVQFIASQTMDVAGKKMAIKSIEAVDKPDSFGAKRFRITLSDTLPQWLDPEKMRIGIENLEWTPSVVFANNVVRHNRARGALFSTPKPVVVEDNLFDHVSGCAVLLCGDCNGWFETGACSDVTIRRNRIVNPLTSLFQFTSAAISIYPEIPNLAGQKGYFHTGIKIYDNEFDLFDAPVLYAKSVGTLVFENNVIKRNNSFKPFHWNNRSVWLERVGDARLQD